MLSSLLFKSNSRTRISLILHFGVIVFGLGHLVSLLTRVGRGTPLRKAREALPGGLGGHRLLLCPSDLSGSQAGVWMYQQRFLQHLRLLFKSSLPLQQVFRI